MERKPFGWEAIGWSIMATAAAFGLLGLIVASRYAIGAEHEHHSAAGRFYAKWMMPDKRNEHGERNVSCCDQKDCYAAEAKQVGEHWFAKIRETGQWVRIPPEKIEHELDNPDGQNHLCASPTGHVYCFSVGGGT